MPRRVQLAFLALVLAQGAHSLEEAHFRLYEVFAPARFVSGLISSDLRQGFILFNVALFAFGVWCWLGPVRRGTGSAMIFIWFWIAIELVNGIGHPLWSLIRRSYTPGVATAPVLLVLALHLARQLLPGARRTLGGSGGGAASSAASSGLGVSG